MMARPFFLFFFFLCLLFSVQAESLPEAESLSKAEPVPEAESEPYKIHLRLLSGFFYGTISEHVFFYDRPISRLDWEENFVPYLGLAGDFVYRRLNLSAVFTGALPVSSGVMEDFDFLLPNSGAVSHYSRHNAKINRHFSLSFDAGINFKLHRSFTLTPGLGFLYINRKWSARDGYKQYTYPLPWTGDEPKTEVQGKVIDYEQNIWALYAGLNALYKINTLIQIGGDFRITPFLFARTLDNHLVTGVAYLDMIRDGFYVSLVFFAEVFPFKKHPGQGLRVQAGYAYLRSLTGTTATGMVGDSPENFATTPGSGSGISGGLWDFGLAYVLRL